MQSFKFVFGLPVVRYEQNQLDGPRKAFISNILWKAF